MVMVKMISVINWLVAPIISTKDQIYCNLLVQIENAEVLSG